MWRSRFSYWAGAGRMRQGARWFVPAGGLVALAAPVLPADIEGRHGGRAGLYLLGAVAVGFGVVRRRAGHPLPWVLLLASQVAFAAGQFQAEVGLAAYPIAAAALAGLARRRSPRSDRIAVLDGVIIFVG